MTMQPIQTKIIDVLRRSPATAEVVAIHLETDVDRIECELEAMFANSKVECARDHGPLYRLVVRETQIGAEIL
jgi:hypothetical protein